GEQVVAGAAVEQIVADAAIKRVVAILPEQAVIAAIAEQGVIARPTLEPVVVGSTGGKVVAGAGEKLTRETACEAAVAVVAAAEVDGAEHVATVEDHVASGGVPSDIVPVGDRSGNCAGICEKNVFY